MAADTEGQWEAPPVRFPIDPTLLRDPYAPNDASRMVHDSRGLFVVHAILLHTGKILCFCGHVEAMFYAPIVYLYDPAAPAATKLKAVAMPTDTDLFCCHYVQLYDGRILIIGGSQQDTPNPGGLVNHGSNGATTITVFDPVSERFVPSPPGLQLTQGRWYPTVVLLADGRALAISGRREAGVTPNIANTVEAISPRADACVTLSGGLLALPIYPGIHLSPDGRLYTTHTTWGQEIAEPPGQRLEVTATSATWKPLPPPAPQPAHNQREEGMSVALPVTLPYPAKKGGRYLVVSGGQALGVARAAPHGAGVMAELGGGARAVFTAQGGGADTRSVEILDTTVDPPAWTAPGPPLALPRVNGHCVLLPDATVLVLGGHDAYKWQAKANVPGGGDPVTTPSLPVEIYSPGSGFTTGASMRFPRMYHAVALLLPDGRVWIAGGADPNENEPPVTYPPGWKGRTFSGGPPGPHLNGQPGTALNRKDYEIYRPPYLCKGLPQPEITGIGPSMQVQYGATFTITTPQAATIAKVAIMRPGAVTHHTDTEQRYIELAKAPPSGTTLTVTMLPATDASLVTPGYYMVWIIDNAGIPCKRAWFIQVSYPPPWPAPAAAKKKKEGLCIVATVTMGSPEAPLVRHLQELRARIAADGPAGRVFIAGVNGGYYSFSPRLAARLQRSPHLSRAVRDVLVIPGAAAIRAAERLSGRVAHPGRRSALLITLLIGEGLVTAAVSPLIVLVAAVHAAAGRLRSRAHRLREERRAGGDDG